MQQSRSQGANTVLGWCYRSQVLQHLCGPAKLVGFKLVYEDFLASAFAGGNKSYVLSVVVYVSFTNMYRIYPVISRIFLPQNFSLKEGGATNKRDLL